MSEVEQVTLSLVSRNTFAHLDHVTKVRNLNLPSFPAIYAGILATPPTATRIPAHSMTSASGILIKSFTEHVLGYTYLLAELSPP
jgi:hypothetical protein